MVYWLQTTSKSKKKQWPYSAVERLVVRPRPLHLDIRSLASLCVTMVDKHRFQQSDRFRLMSSHIQVIVNQMVLLVGEQTRRMMEVVFEPFSTPFQYWYLQFYPVTSWEGTAALIYVLIQQKAVKNNLRKRSLPLTSPLDFFVLVLNSTRKRTPTNFQLDFVFYVHEFAYVHAQIWFARTKHQCRNQESFGPTRPRPSNHQWGRSFYCFPH